MELANETVRLWAFHVAGGQIQAYWYDSIDTRTVRRIHYGSFGDLDVIAIRPLPEDPVSSHFLFAAPQPAIVEMLDNSHPLINKTDANHTLPPRLTMDPFRPFVDTHEFSVNGSYTAARRAELVAHRRALAEPHAVPATHRRRASTSSAVTKTLAKVSCQAGNFCEARTSISLSKGGASSLNTFSLPLGFVDVTMGPVNKAPCMLEVAMGLPVSPVPLVTMEGSIAVELCKDYKGVEVAQGTLTMVLDPIANIPGPIAIHRPLSDGGLNPLAFRLASVTVGLYTYDNNGRNPQCVAKKNNFSPFGFDITHAPAASCTSNYCKGASKNLLKNIQAKYRGRYNDADELCDCLALKQNMPAIAFGGGTDIPGIALMGLTTFIPPVGISLIPLSPFLALFKVTADFTYTWQPYSCGGLMRRDMNLDLAFAIAIPPVPMAFDFFNPEWSTLQHYSKGVLGSHEQVPDVGDAIVGAFDKLETMLQQNMIPWSYIMSLGSKYANAAKAYLESHGTEIVGDARTAIVAAVKTVFKPQTVCVDVITFSDSTCRSWTPSAHVCVPDGVRCSSSCRKKVAGVCVNWNIDCSTTYRCWNTQPVCYAWHPVKQCSCVRFARAHSAIGWGSLLRARIFSPPPTPAPLSSP